MVCLAQTVHLSGIKISTIGANHAIIWWHYLQMDPNELPVESCNLGVPSGVSKMISEPMVRLPHTVHLSCTDTNTVSKQTKTRFQMTHVT
jgi:hypothetical protein